MNNINLWQVIFVYHWNWVAIILILMLAGATGGASGRHK